MQAPVVGGVRLPHGNGETIRLARGASLCDFAEKIDANPASLVQALFNLGEMVTATQSVGDETLELLGGEMNYVVQVVSPEDEDRELLESFDLTYGEDEGDEDDLEIRPPVVTVMGHVDHGKTRLLDTIRKANVREGEAGGITQHIGAYQVVVELDGNERPITFIDTPGHEAFTAMRARGAKATDIAILVVAADDGVMPQTVEAINHAQAADVPIVVAVNKIDKEGADPAKIRAQLTEYNLVAEEFGGDTMFVDISAKQGTNIEALLEAVLLTADAALDLRANPDMEAQGVAIEAHLDRGRGPVATVLVQRGTLRVGDSIVAGDAYGRVRRMVDEHGEDVEEALPSRPVQVIGFTSVPGAGDNLLVVDEDRIARQIADRRSARKRNALAARTPQADQPGGPGCRAEGDQPAQPDPQGRQLRHRRGAGGGPAGHRDRRRGRAARHRPRRRWRHRDQRQPGVGLGRDHHRVQRPRRGQGHRAGQPRGRRHPLLLGDLPGHRRDRERAQGHAQAGLRGGGTRPRRDPRDLPVVEGRQHRRLPRHLRHHPAQRQGPAAARQRRGRREPSRSRRCGGRRTTSPRSATATSVV